MNENISPAKRVYFQNNEIEVIRTSENTIISNTNNTNADFGISEKNHFVLNEDEFQQLLTANHDNVEKLKMWMGMLSEEKNVLFKEGNVEYSRLKCLSIVDKVMADEEFVEVANNCPNLETLQLNGILNRNKETFILGDDVKISTIQNMKMLNCLEIQDSGYINMEEHQYKYSHLEKILKMLDMKKITLNVTIWPDDDGQNTESEADIMEKVGPYKCEYLTVGSFVQNTSFEKFTNIFLKRYANLKKISVAGKKRKLNIDANVFNILQDNCTKLKCLELIKCEISNFLPLKTITELSFKLCKGLSWTNLKQIFSEMNLKRFTTLETCYEGDFEEFPIGASLEYLQLDEREEKIVQLFQMANMCLPNLTTLIWNHKSQQTLESIFQKCPNLQRLTIEQKSVTPGDLLQLQSLEYLEFTCHHGLDLTSFLETFKHSSLKHIFIDVCNFQTSEQLANDCRKYPNNFECQSKLFSLNIPMILFKYMQNIFLDLLTSNAHMEILFHEYMKTLLHYEFLHTLVNNPKFGSSVKIVKIAGLDIALADLKGDFDNTFNKLKSMSTHMEYGAYRPHIILQGFV